MKIHKYKAFSSETLTFLIIIIALTAIRLYHINTPPIELEESWRQADTESIAYNFAEYKFSILYPNFNYDGPLPNVPALEFQITTFIIAILYKLFGINYLWARLVPTTFFMLSACLLYLFTKRQLGKSAALFGLVVYGILPINIYYSRAIMPEAAGLMFFIGSLYTFDCWLTSRRIMVFFLSSVLTALALMTKPMTAFIGIPMLYLLVKKYKWKWLFKKELWAFALLTLGLAIAYYSISIPIAEYKFSQGLAQDVLFKKLPTAIFEPAAYSFIGKSLLKLLTPVGIILTFVGLFSLKRHQLVLLVWFAAMSLEIILVVTVIRIYYYFIFFAVPCCILIGQGLSYLYSKLQSRVLSIILLVLLFLNSYAVVKPMYRINTVMATQVRIVQEHTSREDLLVVGSMDPCLLGLSRRSGWRFNLGIYSNIPNDNIAELDFYIKNGAKYFVPIQGSIYKDKNGEMLEYLDKNYEKLEVVEGFPIYKLQAQ